MKKKHIVAMLAVMTAAAMSMTACGSNKEAKVATETTVEESTEASTEASVENTEEAEPATYEVYITSLTDDKAMGYAADGTLYIFDLGNVTDGKELFVEDAVLEVTDDGAEPVETTYTVDGVDQAAYVAVVTSAVSVDDERAAEIKAEMYASVYDYTVEEQESATKYVSQAMTVYVGADEAADELGTLSAADEVTVTGTTDNGWTQIEYNGETAYIGSESVVDEKPEEQEAAATNNSNTGTSSTSSDSGSTTQSTASAPKEITIDGKTLEMIPSLYLADMLSSSGVTVDTSKMTYRWGGDDHCMYYYQFTLEEVTDTSTITDLESHLAAVKSYE